MTEFHSIDIVKGKGKSMFRYDRMLELHSGSYVPGQGKTGLIVEMMRRCGVEIEEEMKAERPLPVAKMGVAKRLFE